MGAKMLAGRIPLTSANLCGTSAGRDRTRHNQGIILQKGDIQNLASIFPALRAKKNGCENADDEDDDEDGT